MNQITFRWSGAIPGYGEALPNGDFAVYCPGVPKELQTRHGGIPLPDGQPALFLRIANDGQRFACKGHRDDQAWEYDGAWTHRGGTCGTNPVIYDANDVLVVAHDCVPPVGSQGWSHVAPNGALIPTDACYADPSRRLHNFTDFGDVAIGQGGDDIGEGAVVRFADFGILRRLTFRDLAPAGMLRDIRVRRDGDLFAITVVDYGQRLTTMTWAHLIELRQMQPVAPVQPVPQPTPEPEPPMPDTDNKIGLVRQIRRDLYGIPDEQPLNDEHKAFQITKHLAWRLRGEGFGLVRAKAGSSNNVEGYTADIVAKRNGDHWDVLNSVEAGAFPSWSKVGAEHNGPIVARWAEPVQPAGGDAPDPGDEDPEPIPDPSVPPVGDYAVLLAEIRALRADFRRVFR